MSDKFNVQQSSRILFRDGSDREELQRVLEGFSNRSVFNLKNFIAMAVVVVVTAFLGKAVGDYLDSYLVQVVFSVVASFFAFRWWLNRSLKTDSNPMVVLEKLMEHRKALGVEYDGEAGLRPHEKEAVFNALSEDGEIVARNIAEQFLKSNEGVYTMYHERDDKSSGF